jgi:hypothetical protein
MKQTINCPGCGQAYKVSAEQAGTHAACRKCGQGFTLEMQVDETLGVKVNPPGNHRNDDSGAEERGNNTPPPTQPPKGPRRTIQESPPSLGPGKKIGIYQIKRELGRTAMGRGRPAIVEACSRA